MVNNPVKVSEADYLDAVDAYIGWCPVCQEFCRECTEPDAESYLCEGCGEEEVVGAENALIMGLIEIEDE